jgi:hypothetical protein
MKSLAQLNTYSALSVAYADEGTGAQTLADRYQINGVIDTAQPVLKNIEKICSAAGSWLSYDIHDGKWGVVINNSGTSIASFSDTNIIGNINISGTGLTDLYNSVKVEFPHRDLKDSADFVTIEIPGGDRNANEEDNSLQLTYDIINEPVQAQLLGFIELKQSRIDKVIKFQCDYSLFNLKAGDIIDVTNARLAFTSKLFRIVSITEIADTEALKMEITALEYDPNVYSVADLFRYTRTDSNGIISIGSIGTPGTPQVSKFESDSRPRISVSSLAPTGIVEGMEFWVTNDVNIPNEANRSYRLIATQRPTGPNFTSGESVVLEYDALASQDFFIKTRGFNATTTGPYSTPSGLIEYRPKQITDGIGPDTGVFDETGALVTAFAASLLMNKVSDLLLGAVSSSSLFQSIFDAFEDVTGIDLVGEASAGELVVASNLSVADEGTTISPTTSRINFVGTGVTASGNGVVTVNIGGGGGGTGGGLAITGISPTSGPTAGGTTVTITGINLTGASGVTFGGTAATNVVAVSSTQVTCSTPAKTTSTVDVVVTTPLGTTSLTQGFTYVDPVQYLTIDSKYPPDRATGLDPLNGAASNLAPINGSYYAIIGGATWGPLQTGSGSAKLYKSDGTLVETLSAGSLVIDGRLVEFPFATREPGVDYYILLEEGLLTYCNFKTPAITTASPWNFNTPLYSENEFIKYDDWLDTSEGENWPRTEVEPGVFALDRPLPYYVIEFTYNANPPTTTATIAKVSGISVYLPKGNSVPTDSIITLTYTTTVKAGSGSVRIHTTATDAVVGTIPVTSTSSVSVNTITVGSIRPFVDYDTEYYITADAGVVLTDLDYDCFVAPSTPSQAVVKADNVVFRTITAFDLLYWRFNHNPFPNDEPAVELPYEPPSDKNQKVNPQTNILLVFNRTVTAGTIGNFSLYKADGSLHQKFDITDTFDSDKVSELISISGSTVTLNPTEDLEFGATYYLQASPGVATDGKHPWAGITTTTKIRFRVDPGPEPIISPINDDSDTIVLSFDREIQPGAGKVQIYDQLGNFITEVDSDDPSISYS